MKIQFVLSPRMDRAPHRWDECCGVRTAHNWEMVRLGWIGWLRGEAPWSYAPRITWWSLKELAALIVTGRCVWHGSRDLTDRELDALTHGECLCPDWCAIHSGGTAA